MAAETPTDSIPVVIDKSHLVTIGERLYTESVELVRELVNNAYDADATRVRLTVTPEEIVIEDDGQGMDHQGLRQYLTIGSPLKKRQAKSTLYGRDLIGQFGIGKFSALSASDHFDITTRRGDFCATITFDRAEWEKSREQWSLPIKFEAVGFDAPNGTRVTLRHLRRAFEPALIERRLQESVPLKAPHFEVFLNGARVHPRYLAGRRLPFMEGTPFGMVHGEIILSPEVQDDPELSGIEIKVKLVTVSRSLFGLEAALGPQAAQITGEVHADFLPVTSDRSGFVRDTAEYRAFETAMAEVLARTRGELASWKDERENRRVSRSLKEIVHKIQTALMKNMEWCPPGFLPQDPPQAHAAKANQAPPAPGGDRPAKAKRKRVFKLKPVTPSALVRKLKIGRRGLALIMDHFGADGPEAFVQQEVIHVNRDHPLYVREARNRERHLMHVGRLIAQEIALMSTPRNPRQAFERQSKLLSDAFVPVEGKPPSKAPAPEPQPAGELPLDAPAQQ